MSDAPSSPGQEEPSSAGDNETQTPWYARPWVPAVGLLVLVAIVAAVFALTGDDEGDVTAAASTPAAATPTPTPTPTATPTPTPTPTPTATPTPAPTPSATPTPTPSPSATGPAPPEFDAIELAGTGDDEVDLDVPDDAAGIAEIAYTGAANFTIQAFDATGEFPDLLVNTIGDYAGTVPVNFDGDPVRRLEITASGPWTITVRPVADAEEFVGRAEGSGDMVLVAPDGIDGELGITHNGEDAFVVQAYGGDFPELLVDETGDFEGAVGVSDVIALEIRADGRWTVAEGG